MSSDAPASWRALNQTERHAIVRDAWREVLDLDRSREISDTHDWTSRIEQMREAHRDLVERGTWRGGPRTLLAALALQYRELPLTAGLAWLLRPDGHHGLGHSMLTGLLRKLAVDTQNPHPGQVRVVLEETREQTRADLVVYGSDWTLVIEAKVFASEQGEQLDRLHQLWCDEPGPVFVFLTRGQRAPTTAATSDGNWKPLTWEQVAEVAAAMVRSRAGVAPGVHDYITTLESYHRV